jgi:tetratricopeptide (TPR) repeat protein
MAVVNEALRLNPSDVDSLVLRGDMLSAQKQFGAAEADYREALRLRPEYGDALHGLALIENSRGRRRKALRGIVEVGRVDPSYGDVVLQNIGTVLTGVLRRSVWLVLTVGVAIIVAMTLHDGGNPTVVPRIIAGIAAVLLVVMFVGVMREIPGNLLKAVLRQRQMLAVRIVQLGAAVVLGALTAVLGAMVVPAVLASYLVLSLPVVVIVGWLTGERLW